MRDFACYSLFGPSGELWFYTFQILVKGSLRAHAEIFSILRAVPRRLSFPNFQTTNESPALAQDEHWARAERPPKVLKRQALLGGI